MSGPQNESGKTSHTLTFRSEEIYYFNTHRPENLVLSLQKRYEGFQPEEVTKLVKNATGGEVVGVEASQSFGTGHLIYFVDTNMGKVVFRGNRYIDDPEHYMDLEKMFTEKYKKAGIPTNTVIFSDTSRQDADFDFQVMEILPGKDLEDEWDGTEEQYQTINRSLGAMVARQYQAPVKGWGRFKSGDDLEGNYGSAHEYLMAYADYDLSVMTGHGVIKPEQESVILEFLTAQKPMLDKLTQAYLVHHDIADHNIRYEDDKVLAIFDWENAVAFDPVSELGSAHTWTCHYPRRQAMKEGFLEEIGYIPEDFEERISLYFLRTMLWKSAFALKGKRFSERHRELLKEALKETLPSLEIPE